MRSKKKGGKGPKDCVCGRCDSLKERGEQRDCSSSSWMLFRTLWKSGANPLLCAIPMNRISDLEGNPHQTPQLPPQGTRCETAVRRPCKSTEPGYGAPEFLLLTNSCCSGAAPSAAVGGSLQMQVNGCLLGSPWPEARIEPFVYSPLHPSPCCYHILAPPPAAPAAAALLHL